MLVFHLLVIGAIVGLNDAVTLNYVGIVYLNVRLLIYNVSESNAYANWDSFKVDGMVNFSVLDLCMYSACTGVYSNIKRAVFKAFKLIFTWYSSLRLL